MSKFGALLDACVLVPIVPCDTLLRLAAAGTFRPLWSDRILDETFRALTKVHPDIDSNRFLSRLHSMNKAFEDALVSGWEIYEPIIRLRDSSDQHVVAAAIQGDADVIVTNNISDFPAAKLKPFGLEAVTLDEFLLDQMDLNVNLTVQIIKEQSAATHRPRITPLDLVHSLEKSGAPNFAQHVKHHLSD